MPSWVVVRGNTTVYWIISMDAYYMYYLLVVGEGVYPVHEIADGARNTPGIDATYLRVLSYHECRDKVGILPPNVITCIVVERLAPNTRTPRHSPNIPFDEEYLKAIRPVWCQEQLWST